MIQVTQKIRDLVLIGRAADLLNLLMGMSEFNLPTIEKQPMTDEEQRKWQMAILHLKFVVQFGTEVDSIDVGGKKYFSYPTEFEEWLTSGHPGVETQEIVNYLQDNPI